MVVAGPLIIKFAAFARERGVGLVYYPFKLHCEYTCFGNALLSNKGSKGM